MNGIPLSAIKAHLAINVKSVERSLDFDYKFPKCQWVLAHHRKGNAYMDVVAGGII